MRPLKPEEMDLVAGGDGSTITVTGTAPYRGPSGYYPGGGTTETDPNEVSENGGGGYTTAEEHDPNECRDHNALAAEDEIEAKSSDVKEYGSLVYVGANGEIVHSPPIEGNEDGIKLTQVEAWMSANGVTWNQIVGFVHNHPTYMYGGTDEAADINRYPSVGDWQMADYAVSHGAGTMLGTGFAMYVIDTAGDMREFNYSDKSSYTNLTNSQKEQGTNLPETMTGEGGGC